MRELENLLQQCTVKLSLPSASGWGTGFFVAPGLILTCAHLVKNLKPSDLIRVRWQQQANFAKAKLVQRSPEEDLALLQFTPKEFTLPCVFLDEELQAGQDLYFFGYPDKDFEHGCPVTGSCEGLTGDVSPLIKFKQAEVRPGMSGAALLNQQTGKVCGIVKFTRDRSSNLGGGAISTQVILRQFPKLRALQQKFHQQHPVWEQILVHGCWPSRKNLIKELSPYIESKANKLRLTDSRLPSKLLKAEYGIVPFIGREDRLEHMLSWSLSTSPLSIHVLYGQAGMGKTRLMREVCLQLETEGWITGFLKAESVINDSVFQQMINLPFPFILIIDYSEKQYCNIEILLEILQERSSKIPFRLVLIARYLGEWFRPIENRHINNVNSIFFSYNLIAKTELINIRDEFIRLELYWAALDKFQAFLKKEVLESHSLYYAAYQALSQDTFGRPLIIEMLALVQVLGHQENKFNELCRALLNHEELYWLDCLNAYFPNHSQSIHRSIRPLVVINTLLGGQSRKNLRNIAKRIGEVSEISYDDSLNFDLTDKELRHVLDVLEECYANATEPHYLEPLEPDLIGEWLVSEVLSEQRNQNLLQNLLVCLDLHQIKRVFDILNRAANHFSKVGKWLHRGLELNLSQFAPVMLAVANETGGEAAKAITEALKKSSVDQQTIQKLEKELPKYTIDLREARVLIVRQCINNLTQKDDISERARLLAKLSAYLLELNQLEDAQMNAQEAADCYRLLVKDDSKHRTNLALSLNIYAVSLLKLAKSKEAEEPARESLSVYRSLLNEGVENADLRLASSQNILATILGETGGLKEALKLIKNAIQIYGKYGKQAGYSYTIEFANCLANKARLLRALGKYDEAIIETYRASQLFRDFIENRKGQCHFELAISLTGLANQYYELNQSKLALNFSKEAEEILRKLSEKQPKAFRRYLARTLLNQAIIIRVTEKNDYADQPAREALEIFQEIFDSGSTEVIDELSTALSNLGDILREQGQNIVAKELLYRSIALELNVHISNNGTSNLPFLTNSVITRHNLSLTLKSLEEYHGALEFSVAALNRLIPMFKEKPDIYREWLRKLIANYKRICVMIDQLPSEKFREYWDI